MLNVLKNNALLSGKTLEQDGSRRKVARKGYRPIGEYETFGAHNGETNELVPVNLGSVVVMMPRNR